jgi:flagellar biosynthesis protein FlhA
VEPALIFTIDRLVRRASRRSGSATWISTEQRDRASAAGYTVVDPTTALSAHLSEIIRNFLPDPLTRPQTKEVVDRVARTSPNLVEE